MASSAKQLRDLNWKISLLEPESHNDNGAGANNSNQRRSTRTSPTKRKREVQNSSLVLKNEELDLELKIGDCVLIQPNDDNEEDEREDKKDDICVIYDIAYGIENYIEIKVLWFLRLDDIDFIEDKESYNKNDIFLTALNDKIGLGDVIAKVKVISQESFNEISKIDESSIFDTFICRYGVDYDAEFVTAESVIDWDKICDMLTKNGGSDTFYQSVKDSVIKSSVKKTASRNDIRERIIDDYELDEDEDEDEESDGANEEDLERGAEQEYNDEEQEDESESQDSDLDDDSEDSRHTAKRQIKREDIDTGLESPRKMKKLSLSKGKVRSKKSPTISPPSGSIIKEPKSLIKEIRRKKQQKLKTVTKKKNNIPDFGELLAKRLKNSNTNANENNTVGDTLKILRKAKDKLHTSAKIHSLPCRDDEFEQVYYTLENNVLSETGICLYVSGTPGTGKTATVREVIKQLSSAMYKEHKVKLFHYLEINGLKIANPQSCYELLWEKISGGAKVSNNQANENLESYFKDETIDKLPIVVLLDELDQIVTKNQNVMYNFFNWPTYPKSKFIVVAIANTMDLPERLLSNKISSRLGLTRLQFPGYTFQQLSVIIKHRLENLSRLNQDKLIITKDAIEFASRKVASVSGDARRALMICVRAVEIAELEFKRKQEEKGANDSNNGIVANEVYTVTMQHVMKAVNETTVSPITNYLQSLSFMAKNLLIAIINRNVRTGMAENTVGSVIDELNNQMQIESFKTFRENLQDELIKYDDTVFSSHASKDSTEVVSEWKLRVNGLSYYLRELEESGILVIQQMKSERNKLIKLNVSEDEIINVIKKDNLLKDLMVVK